MDLTPWEAKFEKVIAQIATCDDPAHDILHFKRVVKLARQLCQDENGNMAVVIPAAWLHDFVIIAKDDPRRSQASKLSALKAMDFLKEINYPSCYIEEIGHAIECHSFSANIEPQTLEAKIVQDADRLDSIGSIGVARCFATGGLLKRAFYNEQDPFCSARDPNDTVYTLDHFYKKLFTISQSLKTEAGKLEGQRRYTAMKLFIEGLYQEIAA